MSKTIVNELRKSYEHAHGMIEGFIHLCSDELWAQKADDNWPVWQHVYHMLAWQHSVRGPDQAPPATLYDSDATNFKTVPEGAPDRGLIKEFAKVTKEFVDKYWEQLTDDQLGQKHEGASQRQGMDISTASVVAMLSGHIYYHLGVCDTVLRRNGRRGTFM